MRRLPAASPLPGDPQRQRAPRRRSRPPLPPMRGTVGRAVHARLRGVYEATSGASASGLARDCLRRSEVATGDAGEMRRLTERLLLATPRLDALRALTRLHFDLLDRLKRERRGPRRDADRSARPRRDAAARHQLSAPRLLAGEPIGAREGFERSREVGLRLVDGGDDSLAEPLVRLRADGRAASASRSTLTSISSPPRTSA